MAEARAKGVFLFTDTGMKETTAFLASAALFESQLRSARPLACLLHVGIVCRCV